MALPEAFVRVKVRFISKKPNYEGVKDKYCLCWFFVRSYERFTKSAVLGG